MTLDLIAPSITTAVVAAGMYAALRAGHAAGDYPVQSDTDAQLKGYPDDDQLAIGVPWHTGLLHVCRHVGSYVACQAVAVALLALVVPLTWRARTMRCPARPLHPTPAGGHPSPSRDQHDRGRTVVSRRHKNRLRSRNRSQILSY